MALNPIKINPCIWREYLSRRLFRTKYALFSGNFRHDCVTDLLLVIQGTADVSTKFTQDELSKTVDFCSKAFQPAPADQGEAVLEKVEAITINVAAEKAFESALSADKMRILTTIQARQMLRSEDVLNIDNFAADVINDIAPNLRRGDLGLVKTT